MTEILLALISALVLATLCAWLGSYLGSRSNGIAWNGQLGVSEHDCGVPGKFADNAFASRFLLCKAGSDFMHVTPVTAAADEPYGVAIDSPSAGEQTTVRQLGAHKGTQTMVANGAIATLADVYSDGTGKVGVEPNIAGTYWKVGRVVGLASTASGDYVEVETIVPIKVVVIAALTSAQNATAAAVDLATSEALANALKANYNALQADVAAIAGALATPALVKVI